MITIKNISKSYGKLRALSDINITFKQGEIIGLLGANGAGKSTLMKILAGILTADTGEINFFGKNLQEQTLHIKKEIGYLSEDNPLYEDMYVIEYLEYVANIYRVKTTNIQPIIETIGLVNDSKKKIKNLSKGNRQKVGIAQAILHDPIFLILDESSNGLDPLQRENFYKLLINISAEKIILFSTHNLHEIKDICTRFIILDKGRIVADNDSDSIDLVDHTFYKLTNEDNS